MMEYDVFINSRNDTFYLSGINWEEVFSSFNNDVEIRMETFLLLNEQFQNTKVFCRRTNEYDKELIAFKENIKAKDAIQIIRKTNDNVFEYHAYLNNGNKSAKLDSVLPKSFTLKCPDVIQFINDNFNSEKIKQLLNSATKKQNKILAIRNGIKINEGENISEDFTDYIFKSLSDQLP